MDSTSTLILNYLIVSINSMNFVRYKVLMMATNRSSVQPLLQIISKIGEDAGKMSLIVATRHICKYLGSHPSR